MLRFYHHPNCKKSRAGLQYLRDKGQEIILIDYLKKPLKEEELTKLLIKLNKKPQEIIRKQESYYKKNLKGRNFTDHEWIRILIDHPILICRPIVEREYKAVIGVPVTNLDVLLTQPTNHIPT